MILFSLHKKEGWKFWMRFKKPIATYDSRGCFSDAHEFEHDKEIEASVCPCDMQDKRRSWYRKGFREVGTHFPAMSYCITNILSNGKDVVHEHHQCGR